MADITITIIPNSPTVGVYDNLGVWQQATGAILPERIAILDIMPTNPGTYQGTIYNNTEVIAEAPLTEIESTIVFEPETEGIYSEQISVLSDAPNVDIDVSGQMLQNTETDISVLKNRIDFGIVNKTDGEKVLTNEITNIGGEILHIDTITTSPPFFVRETGSGEFQTEITDKDIGKRYNTDIDYYIDENGRTTNNFSLTGMHIGKGNEKNGLDIDVYDTVIINGQQMLLNDEVIIIRRV